MLKKIKIDKRFNDYKIKEFNDYFHLGQEKQKSITYYLNGNKVTENEVLKTGDILEVDFKYETNVIPKSGKLNILYEDENLLILNKERNMLVHSDSKNEDNLASKVYAYYLEKNEDNIISYLGRLDLKTTGIVVFTKNIYTTSYLNQMVENNLLHREYEALTTGKFSELKGVINKKIARDRHNAKKMRIGETGKEAITYYEVVKTNKKYNLVRLTLKTGRTHQIRLHLSSIGNPILGDELYNGSLNETSNLMLNACKIEFFEPLTNKHILVEANNHEFEALANKLFKKKG